MLPLLGKQRKIPVYALIRSVASIATGGYIGPPLKTRFWEGFTFPDHAVADFRKKVRNPPSKDGPEGGGGIFYEGLFAHLNQMRRGPGRTAASQTAARLGHGVL